MFVYPFYLYAFCLFQSSPPHRVRPRASTARCVNLLFHSTHHTGCDVLGRSLHCNHAGFNPRTQGATAQSYPENTDFRSFNPRTHTGCDRGVQRQYFISVLCFNPRTHTGCDAAYPRYFKAFGEFQSTHPHGVRPANASTLGVSVDVSIHAPTRGATHKRQNTYK